MPSMWLADLTLDLLTVRVCFRKYLIILVRLEKKKKYCSNKLRVLLAKSSWRAVQSSEVSCPLLGELAGCCRAEHIQVSRSLRGSAKGSFKPCPGRSWMCWGNTMSCVVDVAFVNTASCFHVNTVESFSSGDFLVFWYTERLLPLLSGTDAGWTKSTCGSKEGVFMLLSQPSHYSSGSGCSARYSRTGLVTSAAWKKETSPCQVTWSTPWLQSTPLLLQVVLWTSENILRGAIKKCRGMPEKHHFFLRLCLGAEHLGSLCLKATDG